MAPRTRLTATQLAGKVESAGVASRGNVPTSRLVVTADADDAAASAAAAAASQAAAAVQAAAAATQAAAAAASAAASAADAGDADTARIAAEAARVAAEAAEDAAAAMVGTALLKASNLSDLANAATARTNLGVSATADTLLKSGNLSGLADATTSRSNLGLGNVATRNVGTAAGTAAAGDDARIVAGDAAATTIAGNDWVTNAKLANMANATVKGRVTSGTGDPEDLTGAQVRDTVLPAGMLVGSDIATYVTNADINGVIPLDDSVPLSTEGTEVISKSYATKANANKVRLGFTTMVAPAAGVHITYAIFAGTTCIRAGSAYSGGTNEAITFATEVEHSPGSTSSVTYSVRVGTNGGTTIRLNGAHNARYYGGTAAAVLSIEELKG